MNRSLLYCSALMLLFSAVTAWAADVTGSWSGQFGNTDFQISFSFKQDGTKLTGSVAGPQGDPIEIKDGKVDGDKVSFNVSFNGMTIHHEGTISGDEIKLTSKADQGDFPGGEMTLKRSR
jgi:hypothetical protein